MFKKLVLWLGIIWFLAAWSLTTVNAIWWNQASFDQNWFWSATNSDIAGISTTETQGSSLVGIIKNFINWTLGMLSLIALVMLLFGWFKMVTAAGDETKYKDGFKILQQAAVWLAIIWLSWFIVSIIFWVINSAGGGWQTPA